MLVTHSSYATMLIHISLISYVLSINFLYRYGTGFQSDGGWTEQVCVCATSLHFTCEYVYTSMYIFVC